jgi:hypothetical protein
VCECVQVVLEFVAALWGLGGVGLLYDDLDTFAKLWIAFDYFVSDGIPSKTHRVVDLQFQFCFVCVFINPSLRITPRGNRC